MPQAEQGKRMASGAGRFRSDHCSRTGHAVPFWDGSLETLPWNPFENRELASPGRRLFGGTTASQSSVRVVRSIVALVSLLAIGTAWAEPVQLSAPAGYESQARYLLTFAEFIDWPASRQNQTLHPTINFCILGRDPYGISLDKAVLGHMVGERRTVITRARRLVDLGGGCDVLFVSSSEEKHEVEILRKLEKQDVLTVGDTGNFAAHGGIIQFVWEQNHLGFLINVDAAARAGLKINASLLALAQIVHDEPARTELDSVH